jgi:DNA-binding NarL/FixJ family response regulator
LAGPVCAQSAGGTHRHLWSPKATRPLQARRHQYDWGNSLCLAPIGDFHAQTTLRGSVMLPASEPHNRPITLVIVDDHQVLRDGLRASFIAAGCDVLGEASDGARAVDLVLELRPDVVLMDMSMPRVNGIEATKRIRAAWPDARILMLTMWDDTASTRAALSAGAVGYLSKDTSFADILQLVTVCAERSIRVSRDIARNMLDRLQSAPLPSANEEVLSPRQIEVLKAIAAGMSTGDVARRFEISPKTVNNHLAAIYRRLDTQNLAQAVIRGVKLGIIDLD